MKKFLTFLAAGVLVIIALATLGHIVGLVIGAAIAYWSLKAFLKAEGMLGKLVWGIIGLLGLSVVFGNFPAIIGIGALAFLYYGCCSCRKKCNRKGPEEYESFHNFEEEWKRVMKYS